MSEEPKILVRTINQAVGERRVRVWRVQLRGDWGWYEGEGLTVLGAIEVAQGHRAVFEGR